MHRRAQLARDTPLPLALPVPVPRCRSCSQRGADQPASTDQLNPSRRGGRVSWAREDSNFRPHPYQGCALTGLSYGPQTGGECIKEGTALTPVWLRNMVLRGCSSVRQSTWFASRGSGVRIPSSPQERHQASGIRFSEKMGDDVTLRAISLPLALLLTACRGDSGSLTSTTTTKTAVTTTSVADTTTTQSIYTTQPVETTTTT